MRFSNQFITQRLFYVIFSFSLLCNLSNSFSTSTINSVTSRRKSLFALSKPSTTLASTITKVNYERLIAKFAFTAAGVGNLLFNPIISGGILAGGLHAVTGHRSFKTALPLPPQLILTSVIGPDHLAAIFPSSIGKNYTVGVKMGITWGLGHGLSATLLGLGGCFFRGTFFPDLKTLEKFSKTTEVFVGISLIFIGLEGLGVRLLPEPKSELVSNDDDQIRYTEAASSTKSMRSLFINGFIHGFSLDSGPSLMPALVLKSWRKATSFLLSYWLGTVLIMGATAGTVAESTRKLGKAVNRVDLTRTLTIGSSWIALGVGALWIGKALL